MKGNDNMGRIRFFRIIVFMIWVVDDHEIDVLFRAEEGVEILQWDQYKKRVGIPVGMRNAEAVWTIRNLLKTKHLDISMFLEEKLVVFGKHWPVKRLAVNKAPYLDDGIVYCYTRGNQISSALKNRIVAQLLQQLILREVGQWEEILNVLIPSIVFRKNKKQPYIVQRSKSCICFDKELYHLSLDVITYCVFKAVAEYGVLTEDSIKRIIEKYFPTWKTLEKSIVYAYMNKV